HQPVTDDGVSEAEWNQHQAQYGTAHPGTRRGIEGKRDDVEQCEGQAARERTSGQPFELLAQNTRWRFPETLVKNHAGSREIHSEVAQLNPVEQQARAKPRHETQHVVRRAYMKQEEQYARSVNQR